MISRKKNTKDNGGRHIAVVAVCLGLLLLAGIGVGAALVIGKLTEIWQEQCRVNDPEIQAVIDNRSTRKMVHDEIVITHFNLTNGANLATIPFAELRRELLDRVPNIRDIRIERTLPNRVTVKVDERNPIARVGLRGRNGASGGRVADLEGVVFRYSSNTETLPLIREAASPPTAPGKRLSGFAAAALRLVDIASQPEFADIRILEIDTASPDYLLVVLSNQDRVKIAWDRMLDDTSHARESLKKQLKRVVGAINAKITPNTTVWIATDWGTPGRVFASPPTRNGNQ